MYKLGFGCAGLTSLNDKKASLSVLEHAFSEGITHFDVARLYGMGMAEGLLGEFAQNKRDKITITSKFGLNPSSLIIKNAGLFSLAKSVVKKVPFIQQLVKKKLNAKIETVFTIENAHISLDKSLSELKTDYIDYYLLHEATLKDANSEELINFLDSKVKEGKILKYGIGTTFSNLQNDCSKFNDAYSIFQFENNIFNETFLSLKNTKDKLLISHSAFRNLQFLLQNWGNLDSNLIRVYSKELDIDLKDSACLPGLLLFHSTSLNPVGLTLFSSTRKQNISDNLKYYSHFTKHNFKEDTFNNFIRLIQNELRPE